MNVDINNMPEAIKDDCLKDTFVTISYSSDYSKDYLEELAIKKITEVFGPNEFSKIPLVLNGVVQDGQWFWANDQYRFMFNGESLQFNIVSHYPKWATYSQFIHQLLDSFDGKIVFKGVSVRYVSFFLNEELANMIDGTLKMNQLDAFPGAQYRFRCSARDDNSEVVASAEVQLSDRYQMNNNSLSSIIDINVWRDCRGSMEDVFYSMDLVHKHQKHLFFLLLSESFYNQLKV